ncbi:MAG: ATP-binding protein, partial [Rickettsiales bacterium]|nr:ATP-binding protein [Rickettsiales bacterium]
KRFLPKTLFGRALMILVIPVVGVQLLTMFMFFERHWDSVVRNLSNTLAGEVSVLIDAFQNTDKNTRMPYTAAIGDMLGIGVVFERGKPKDFEDGRGQEAYPDFFKDLTRKLKYPVMLERVGPEQDILISVKTEGGVLKLHTTKKRLVSPTTYILVLWMIGTAVVLLMVAILFLRNQIRPIRQLAKAAEQFGMGNDTAEFEPRGAYEVRQAGNAFVTMKNRIARQVSNRTEMLAGISHDLRTPLTRMKLQIAMLSIDDKAKNSMQSDIEEMEHMIKEYLDFARGEAGEQTQEVDIGSLIDELVATYVKHDDEVVVQENIERMMMLRPNLMRRALQNIIDNAIRYGSKAEIRLREDARKVYITVADKGPGIPEDKHEEVFRPFTRLDPSRNHQTGGAGLGLSIAKDAAVSHGGSITLKNVDEGLEVTLVLPIQQRADL